MTQNHLATSTTTIQASTDRVWSILTDPEAIKTFMFGTDVITDWTIGSPILWRGVWQDKKYEDRGVILEFDPGRRLVNTHFSPLSGQEDRPENYHTLTWTLVHDAGATNLTLSQDNNATTEQAAHSKSMWDTVVETVKTLAEAQA